MPCTEQIADDCLACGQRAQVCARGLDYAVNDRQDRVLEMLSWLRGRREASKRTEAAADKLIHNLGVAAYSAARRREHEATCKALAGDWRRVALAVARKTGRRVGLDTSTRMATDAKLGAEGNPGARSPQPLSDVDPLDELMRLGPGAMVRPVRTPKRLRHWRRHVERKQIR